MGVCYALVNGNGHQALSCSKSSDWPGGFEPRGSRRVHPLPAFPLSLSLSPSLPLSPRKPQPANFCVVSFLHRVYVCVCVCVCVCACVCVCICICGGVGGCA